MKKIIYKNGEKHLQSEGNQKRLFAHYNLSLTDVAKLCSNHFEVSIDVMKSQSREAWFVKARHCFTWLIYHFSNISVVQIGDFLGGRDHTTVLYGRDCISDALSINDERIVPHIEKLKAECLKFEPKPDPKTVRPIIPIIKPKESTVFPTPMIPSTFFEANYHHEPILNN